VKKAAHYPGNENSFRWPSLLILGYGKVKHEIAPPLISPKV
jgi:hypothetical protein